MNVIPTLKQTSSQEFGCDLHISANTCCSSWVEVHQNNRKWWLAWCFLDLPCNQILLL